MEEIVSSWVNKHKTLTESQLMDIAVMSYHSERFEDMFAAITQIIHLKGFLTEPQQTLFSDACKRTIAIKRTACLKLTELEQSAENQLDNQIKIHVYRDSIFNELKQLCQAIIKIIKEKLMPKANTMTSVKCKAFYLKMIGDAYRYQCEFERGEPRNQLIGAAHSAYQHAMQSCETLECVDPIRLSVAVNYSVFLYEACNNPEQACALARIAYEDAVANVDELNPHECEDSMLLIDLLRSNLKIWSFEDAVISS